MLPPQDADWAQLIYATKGSLTVECPLGERLWYVPARRALFVPAGIVCRLQMRGIVRLRMLYLHSAFFGEAIGTAALNVSPLLHEAILEAARLSVLPSEAPLTLLILQLLTTSTPASLMLPLPRDSRALRITERLLATPATQETMPQLARSAGASHRTLERIFARETGMGFAAWRQRMRLLESMRRLLDGDSVADAAFAVGYESVSAFVAAFKKTTGESPGRWIRR